MDRVEEIESAIINLPPAEYERLLDWFRQLEEARWDEQMDRDSADGKLDFLFEEADGKSSQAALRAWPARK